MAKTKSKEAKSRLNFTPTFGAKAYSLCGKRLTQVDD